MCARFLVAATLGCLVFAGDLQAGNLTYDIVPVTLDWSPDDFPGSGEYSVTGTITTNGKFGNLTATDIVDYSINVNGAYPFLFTPTNPGGEVQIWGFRNLDGVFHASAKALTLIESYDLTFKSLHCGEQYVGWHSTKFLHIPPPRMYRYYDDYRGPLTDFALNTEPFSTVATRIPWIANIRALGTVFPNGDGPAGTIDDDFDTYWHGTNGLRIGDVDFLAYRFDGLYDITKIDIFSDDRYHMGELDLQYSLDSTDGQDGTWTTFESVAGDFDPPSGDFSILPDIPPTKWIRFVMEYQGRAAHGDSPAFYVSEVRFYDAAIPEPTAIVLVLFGVTVIVACGRRATAQR